MANSTETVTQLNQLAHHTRLAANELHPKGPRLRVGEYTLLVGDEVVTRRNNRTLRTDQGLMVKKRLIRRRLGRTPGCQTHHRLVVRPSRYFRTVAVGRRYQRQTLRMREWPNPPPAAEP